jgi:hypothetical protein
MLALAHERNEGAAVASGGSGPARVAQRSGALPGLLRGVHLLAGASARSARPGLRTSILER